MSRNIQDAMGLYRLARNVNWRLQLDALEDAGVRNIEAALAVARADLQAQMEGEVAQGILEGTLGEDQLTAWLDDMTLAVRQALTGELTEMTVQTAKSSLVEHAAILSIDGTIPGVNTVALTEAQIKTFFQETPLGGRLIGEWVDRSFLGAMQRSMLTELRAGALLGEGYPALSARLADGMGLAERDAITLARTFVQTANVEASMATAEANSDIVTTWRWCATLEPGFHATGRGTCLRCAALDGKEFKLGEGPACPLHPRCRCCPIFSTISWRELGVDLPELKRAMRPYTMRPDENIDAGLRRTILESGFHDGDYGTWFDKQNDAFKLNVLGPQRFDLVKAGRATLGDMVDGQGNLRTLAELQK